MIRVRAEAVKSIRSAAVRMYNICLSQHVDDRRSSGHRLRRIFMIEAAGMEQFYLIKEAAGRILNIRFDYI